MAIESSVVTNKDRQTIARERLGEIIRDRMLDPMAVAEKAGIHPHVMSALRSGRRRITELYDYRLCEALGLPHGYFLRGVERAAS